jgi:hypothetical protein
MPLSVTVVLAVVAVLLAVTGLATAPSTTKHRLAERWSVDVLRHVPGWQVLDATNAGEVDRVIAAPGAVLAVVVRSTNSDSDRAAAAAAADQVRRMLRVGRERAAHPVVAVLAVTCHDAIPGDGYTVTDAVHVVDGIRPERWLHRFAEPGVAADERLAVVATFAPHEPAPQRTLRPTWRGWSRTRHATHSAAWA